MEKVYFFSSDTLFEAAEFAFQIHKKKIHELLPEADIQHVGSSAIPNSLTKGDLDIQVRVNTEAFLTAVKALSTIYESNEGSIKTDFFRSFKDDHAVPPLGVQLTVIGSEFDDFWKFREVLLMNLQYRHEYDQLKKQFEGKEMEDYREAKHAFFQRLMKTKEFNNL
ncbi:GrpB family protein [Anaerobacillus sp. CMMVII]|uniref:GrpB family protein n=1 Tax=Anaerobacillus sp. CMMVII TaxID=2755588 RepID=UPI0021B707C0|nr:GrpB family protein [Anaerobacillus sp. CMMVII]MCT8137315.1 GrpB family protein [Anaerobacillus sp. CMMVII]